MSRGCRMAAALLVTSSTLFLGQTRGLAQEVGVSESHILFGQSAAFSGPARELGRNMRLGIEAAFHEANARDGVYDRKLELQSLDDAYEPEAAIANTHQLIHEHKVFALIGAVGTPTSRASTPVAASAGVPYIAPFTGAAFLREEEWRNVINLRASYSQEIDTMITHLTDKLGINRIGVMYQDESASECSSISGSAGLWPSPCRQAWWAGSPSIRWAMPRTELTRTASRKWRLPSELHAKPAPW